MWSVEYNPKKGEDKRQGKSRSSILNSEWKMGNGKMGDGKTNLKNKKT